MSQTNLSGILKAEYIVYLCICTHIGCMCKNKTV